MTEEAILNSDLEQFAKSYLGIVGTDFDQFYEQYYYLNNDDADTGREEYLDTSLRSVLNPSGS